MQHRYFHPSIAQHSQRVFLALSLLVVFLLSACGGGASSTSDVVQLKYGWWSDTPAKDNAMRAWIKDFESSHPNIKISAEILPWDNYWDKLKTTSAGGNAWDIVGDCSCMIAPYYSKNMFVDLSTFSDYQDSVKNLAAGPLKLHNWDNKQYGLPIGVVVSSLGYSKTMFDAAGVAYPDPLKPMDYPAFKTMLSKLVKKDASGKVTQYAINPGSWLTYEGFVYMEGGSTYDKAVNPKKVTINTPAGIRGLQDYLDLFQQNLAPPYEQLANGPYGDGEMDSLQTNKVAIARIGPWAFNDIVTQKLNYGIAPLPGAQKAVMVGDANALAIYRGSKHPKEAWEFLKWASEPHGETSFAKFSDIPADKTVQSQLDTIVQPKDYVPTLLVNLKNFTPSTMTDKVEITTTFSEIITDMAHGKLTAAQAAAKMEQSGNTILAGQ